MAGRVPDRCPNPESLAFESRASDLTSPAGSGTAWDVQSPISWSLHLLGYGCRLLLASSREIGAVMREAMLALLAKEPAHGYELRQRLAAALGPVGEVLNSGQVYVTLARLERAGLVRGVQVAQSAAPDKKVYEVTAAGREEVAAWLLDSSWPRVAPVEFHLKLVAAAGTGVADPVALIDAQRRELMRRLREVQRLAESQTAGDDGEVCCCWRARRCGCRPTSAGSRRARSGGPGGRDERGRARRGSAAPLPG